MIMLKPQLITVVLLVAIGSSISVPDFCEDGHLLSAVYNECWRNSQFMHKEEEDGNKTVEVYTAKYVEEYANFMCSKVKPGAIECLQNDVKDCSNPDKLVSIANESGGTCNGNSLNSFFKLHIIDHLRPVRADSACVALASDHHCSSDAIKTFQKKKVPISRYYREADKLFSRIWKCQVDYFKSKEDVCKDWQLPMLLSLQYMAMPFLYGMKLTNDHVAMLELEKNLVPRVTTPAPSYEDQFYILLKVLSQRPDPAEGDFVLQVGLEEGPKVNTNNIKIITKAKANTKAPNKNKKPGKT